MAMDGLRHGIHSSIRDYSTLMKKTFGQHPAYSTVRKVLFQAPAKASPHQPHPNVTTGNQLFLQAHDDNSHRAPSCCGVLFNLLQPTPLKIPAIWGCVFISLNMFQVHFKDEEAEVYEAVFQRHGVTPHQFEKLMRHAGAQWRDLPAGHMVLKEGDFVDTVSVVVSGRGEVWREGEVVGEVKKGNLVGETSLLAKAHQTGHTVVTSEPTRIVCWPRLKLGQVLTEDKSLLLSAAQMINSDLSVKLANSAHLSSRTAILQTYEEVLHGICADGVIQPAEKRALREYRTRHHITQAQHLEALSKCGWSPVEFEDGMMLRNSKVSSKPFFSIKRSINNFNENVAKVAAATHGASKAPTSHEVDENIGSSKPTSTSTELPPSKGQQPVTKEAV
eukprot:jgi/Mesen1/3898/ME000208S02908